MVGVAVGPQIVQGHAGTVEKSRRAAGGNGSDLRLDGALGSLVRDRSDGDVLLDRVVEGHYAKGGPALGHDVDQGLRRQLRVGQRSPCHAAGTVDHQLELEVLFVHPLDIELTAATRLRARQLDANPVVARGRLNGAQRRVLLALGKRAAPPLSGIVLGIARQDLPAARAVSPALPGVRLIVVGRRVVQPLEVTTSRCRGPPLAGHDRWLGGRIAGPREIDGATGLVVLAAVLVIDAVGVMAPLVRQRVAGRLGVVEHPEVAAGAASVGEDVAEDEVLTGDAESGRRGPWVLTLVPDHVGGRKRSLAEHAEPAELVGAVRFFADAVGPEAEDLLIGGLLLGAGVVVRILVAGRVVVQGDGNVEDRLGAGRFPLRAERLCRTLRRARFGEPGIRRQDLVRSQGQEHHGESQPACRSPKT